MAADTDNLSVERVAFTSSHLMASRVLLNQLVKCEVRMTESYVLHAIHDMERNVDLETDSVSRYVGKYLVLAIVYRTGSRRFPCKV